MVSWQQKGTDFWYNKISKKYKSHRKECLILLYSIMKQNKTLITNLT